MATEEGWLCAWARRIKEKCALKKVVHAVLKPAGRWMRQAEGGNVLVCTHTQDEDARVHLALVACTLRSSGRAGGCTLAARGTRRNGRRHRVTQLVRTV